MRLDGLGALISGGASGLGEATARLLAERGACVAIVDLDAEKAAALARELGDRAVSFPADVTSEQELRAAVEGALAGFGELRLVVAAPASPSASVSWETRGRTGWSRSSGWSA